MHHRNSRLFSALTIFVGLLLCVGVSVASAAPADVASVGEVVWPAPTVSVPAAEVLRVQTVLTYEVATTHIALIFNSTPEAYNRYGDGGTSYTAVQDEHDGLPLILTPAYNGNSTALADRYTYRAPSGWFSTGVLPGLP